MTPELVFRILAGTGCLGTALFFILWARAMNREEYLRIKNDEAINIINLLQSAFIDTGDAWISATAKMSQGKPKKVCWVDLKNGDNKNSGKSPEDAVLDVETAQKILGVPIQRSEK